ncbi:MAG: GNAT family N-acetyltransferase [Ruminococcus sp.]|nr:GNAT family N-acetyltransferase [Ruminococcus sp.]
MLPDDENTVANMMKTFYSSPAVSTNGSDEIFHRDFSACISDNPFIEGYIILDDLKTAGYAMLAKSFCTEFGKPCVWIEDIYILPEHRGKGFATAFVNSIKEKYLDSVIRLEVEDDNISALSVYKKCGFTHLPYKEMIFTGGTPNE